MDNQKSLNELSDVKLNDLKDKIKEKLADISRKREHILSSFIMNFNINSLEVATHSKNALDLLKQAEHHCGYLFKTLIKQLEINRRKNNNDRTNTTNEPSTTP